MSQESLVDYGSLPFRLRSLKEGKEVTLHRLKDAPAVSDHPAGTEGLTCGEGAGHLPFRVQAADRPRGLHDDLRLGSLNPRSTRALSICEVPVYSAPMLAVAMKTQSGCTLMLRRPFPPAMSTGSSRRASRHGRRMLFALRGALDSSSSRMTQGFWMSSVNFA